MKSEAQNLETKPESISDLYRSTPLGRATATAEKEECQRVSKLVDIAYTLAKEELPFSKYPKIAELELRHGVKLGNSFVHEVKCKEFMDIIVTLMEEEVLELARSASYVTVLMDGSTDVTNVEKELMYIMFVNSKTGVIEIRFLGLKDVKHSHLQRVGSTFQRSWSGFAQMEHQ